MLAPRSLTALPTSDGASHCLNREKLKFWRSSGTLVTPWCTSVALSLRWRPCPFYFFFFFSPPSRPLAPPQACSSSLAQVPSWLLSSSLLTDPIVPSSSCYSSLPILILYFAFQVELGRLLSSSAATPRITALYLYIIPPVP